MSRQNSREGEGERERIYIYIYILFAERVNLNQKWYEHLKLRLFMISFLYLPYSINVFSP